MLSVTSFVTMIFSLCPRFHLFCFSVSPFVFVLHSLSHPSLFNPLWRFEMTEWCISAITHPHKCQLVFSVSTVYFRHLHCRLCLLCLRWINTHLLGRLFIIHFTQLELSVFFQMCSVITQINLWNIYTSQKLHSQCSYWTFVFVSHIILVFPFSVSLLFVGLFNF